MNTTKTSPMVKRVKKEKEWKSVKTTEDKKEFQKMVEILNRFYSQHTEMQKTESFRNRETFCKANTEELEIYIQKFGEYEFLIYCHLVNTEIDLKDSWIQVDGISQERKEWEETRKNKFHPVFTIVCISDIWERAEKATLEELEKLT